MEELLDTLLAEGIIKKQEGATSFVAPSFMVSKPHDPEKGLMMSLADAAREKTSVQVLTELT